MGGTRASGVLTSRAAYNVAFVDYTILSALSGWPLLITPGAGKVEPAGTLRDLKVSSDPSAGRNGNLAG